LVVGCLPEVPSPPFPRRWTRLVARVLESGTTMSCDAELEGGINRFAKLEAPREALQLATTTEPRALPCRVLGQYRFAFDNIHRESRVEGRT
jgi:hypothetical protein